jgi:hypothetical protein
MAKEELPWREIQKRPHPGSRFTRAQARAAVKTVIADRLAREAAEKEAKLTARKAAKAAAARKARAARKAANGGTAVRH